MYTHAVGNAAFHSSQLYTPLTACIPPLKLALDEADEKTRANAAGAIGNLVRHSAELAPHLAQMEVPQALMRMALVDKDPAAQVRVITDT